MIIVSTEYTENIMENLLFLLFLTTNIRKLKIRPCHRKQNGYQPLIFFFFDPDETSGASWERTFRPWDASAGKDHQVGGGGLVSPGRAPPTCETLGPGSPAWPVLAQ